MFANLGSSLLLLTIIVTCASAFAFRSPLRACSRIYSPFHARSILRAGGCEVCTPPSVTEKMTLLKKDIVDQSDVAATLRNLIQYGDHWLLSSDKTMNSGAEDNSVVARNMAQTELERVTGCTSVVKIKTSLVPLRIFAGVGESGPTTQVVRVDGSADSRVTQGMLAILCKVMLSALLQHTNPLTLHDYFRYLTIWRWNKP